jgi:GT2 family glycosyltransferase
VERADVSICIVNWNGREMVRSLLRSIECARGEQAVQTIVVDNASADGSAELVAREFGEVELVRNARNVGFARANNQASERARGRYLLFLNNDTLVRSGAVQSLMEFLEQDRAYVAAAPLLIGSDGRPQESVRNLPTLEALLDRVLIVKWTRLFRAAYRDYREPPGFSYERSADVAQVAAAALMVRRDAFERCGRWDEGFEFGVEDVDLCRRLGAAGRIRYVAEATVEHLGRISSRANRSYVYRGYECGWARYVRKHHGPRPAWIYKALVTADMPVRVLQALGAWAIKRAMGKTEQAERYRQRFCASAAFVVNDLGKFWRA